MAAADLTATIQSLERQLERERKYSADLSRQNDELSRELAQFKGATLRVAAWTQTDRQDSQITFPDSQTNSEIKKIVIGETEWKSDAAEQGGSIADSVKSFLTKKNNEIEQKNNEIERKDFVYNEGLGLYLNDTNGMMYDGKRYLYYDYTKNVYMYYDEKLGVYKEDETKKAVKTKTKKKVVKSAEEPQDDTYSSSEEGELDDETPTEKESEKILPCVRMIVFSSKAVGVTQGDLSIATCDRPFAFGRDAKRDLVLEEDLVSKYHAVITFASDTSKTSKTSKTPNTTDTTDTSDTTDTTDTTDMSDMSDTSNLTDTFKTFKMSDTSKVSKTSKVSDMFKVSDASETFKYWLQDFGSQNGTFLNSKRLSAPKEVSEKHELTHRDLILIGSTTLIVHIHEGLQTCDDCEPGVVLARAKEYNATLSAAPFQKESEISIKNKNLHKQKILEIKKKYGLAKEKFVAPAAPLVPDYVDRSRMRRAVVGSDHPSTERTAAPASVHVPITGDNKGFQMLSKMGWNEGEGLNSKRKVDSISEPISTLIRLNEAAGLGADSVGEHLSMDTDAKSRQQKEKWIKTAKRYQGLPTYTPTEKQAAQGASGSKSGNMQWVRGGLSQDPS